MNLRMDLGEKSYDITIEHGALARAGEYLDLARRVCIVTDSGVPAAYAQTLATQCREPLIVTVPQGEENKNLDTFSDILAHMLDAGLTRSDCVVAVGGGVVGDMAGFAASAYMRGIDFYNIPTTLLSQIDSSIGGKVAVDFHGYKNLVGAFHQPRAVVIDPDTLNTLPARQIANGLAEAIKMAATSDAELFALLETQDAMAQIDTVIERSLCVKRDVVQQDERETGLRRVLNFGHTLGHAIETCEGLGGLYHGECVALGMLGMCSSEVRARLVSVLARVGLPTTYTGDAERILEAMRHDKKMSGSSIHVVTVPEIGRFEFEKVSFDVLSGRMREALNAL